jgi:hypothetical protein
VDDASKFLTVSSASTKRDIQRLGSIAKAVCKQLAAQSSKESD